MWPCVVLSALEPLQTQFGSLVYGSILSALPLAALAHLGPNPKKIVASCRPQSVHVNHVTIWG